MRELHYVLATHWDREWYDSFQGFRMRLVSLLDEVFACQDQRGHGPFSLDGQAIPVHDYLEIRPERAADVRARVADGRLVIGPWYVLPDEVLVGGESLVRNLELGMATARELGGSAPPAGFCCDQFGHPGQLPQIFAQLGLRAALVWRGVAPRPAAFAWQAADGSAIATHRFGRGGYTTFHAEVRKGGVADRAVAVARLVAHARAEVERSDGLPPLLFDGGDHAEVEPAMAELIAEANRILAADDLRIVWSDLGRWAEAAAAIRPVAHIVGELRRPGREPHAIDEAWLIPGVLSSRPALKQANAACEDELCLWAEPFTAFARRLGVDPELFDGRTAQRYLAIAWRHLIENHPHDSICGCSIDPVHRDMRYRFDQAMGIAARISSRALAAIAAAAAPAVPAPGFALTVFNHVPRALDEVVELDLPLPTSWPASWAEFFWYEQRFGIVLRDADGREIQAQVLRQDRDQRTYALTRREMPAYGARHHVRVAARLRLPACGWTNLAVTPDAAPRRTPGTLLADDRTLDNGILRVGVDADGTLRLRDHRSGAEFTRLLAIEDRGDIGDGWFWCPPLNDQVVGSTGAPLRVSVVADGPLLARLRVDIELRLPAGIDPHRQLRRAETVILPFAAEITLRAGSDRVEVAVQFDNTAQDHRLRLLFPTGLRADRYWTDAVFAVVERPVAIDHGDGGGKELEVEGRPQQAWTAISDGRHGLAVVCRGSYETCVIDRPDRPIALTLLRGFARHVFSNPQDNPDGQSPGPYRTTLWLVPFAGTLPRLALAEAAQRVGQPPRAVVVAADKATGRLSPNGSLLAVAGASMTSLRDDGTATRLRLVNLDQDPVQATISGLSAHTVETLAGAPMPDAPLAGTAADAASVHIPPARIATLRVG